MNVKWKLAPDGRGGWAGVIDIPLHPGAVYGGGRVVAMAKGGDRAEALGKAAAIAKKIAENPIVAAILPPQAGVAIKAISVMSKAAKAGHLDDAIKKFAGPGLKRLGKVLGF